MSEDTLPIPGTDATLTVDVEALKQGRPPVPEHDEPLPQPNIGRPRLQGEHK